MEKNDEKSDPDHKQFLELIKGVILSLDCDQSMIHKNSGRLAYLCYAPRCAKRLICDRCLLSDNKHVQEHRVYIKTIPEFQRNLLEALDSSPISKTLIKEKNTVKKLAEEIKVVRERVKKRVFDYIKKMIDGVFDLVFQEIQSIFDGFDSEIKQHMSQFGKFGIGTDSMNEISKQKLRDFLSLAQDQAQAEVANNTKHHHELLNQAIELIVNFAEQKQQEDQHLNFRFKKQLSCLKTLVLKNQQLDELVFSGIMSKTGFMKSAVEQSVMETFQIKDVKAVSEKLLNRRQSLSTSITQANPDEKIAHQFSRSRIEQQDLLSYFEQISGQQLQSEQMAESQVSGSSNISSSSYHESSKKSLILSKVKSLKETARWIVANSTDKVDQIAQYARILYILLQSHKSKTASLDCDSVGLNQKNEWHELQVTKNDLIRFIHEQAMESPQFYQNVGKGLLAVLDSAQQDELLLSKFVKKESMNFKRILEEDCQHFKSSSAIEHKTSCKSRKRIKSLEDAEDNQILSFSNSHDQELQNEENPTAQNSSQLLDVEVLTDLIFEAIYMNSRKLRYIDSNMSIDHSMSISLLMFKNSCESQFKKLLGELYFSTKNLRSSPDYELSIQKYQGIAPSVTISEVFRILKASEAFKEGVNTSCEKSEKIVENQKILGSKEIED